MSSPELDKILFQWYDYIILGLLLSVSTFIGIRYGKVKSCNKTKEEYFLGSRKMGVISTALSLVASHISCNTLILIPTEVYLYGALYWWICVGLIGLAFITAEVSLPVIYNLKLVSIYEYLELRFDKRCRNLASFLFLLNVFIIQPTIIYTPALALSAASGISIYVIIPVVCSICVFYTTIGGIRAVIWTDNVQLLFIYCAFFVIMCLGVNAVGGLNIIWSTAVRGGRLDIFEFSPDLTKRETVWTYLIGVIVHFLGANSVNQTCFQKFLSVSTLRKSKMSAIVYFSGIAVVEHLAIFFGLLLYAKYADCDPFLNSKIEKKDQILPLFVLEVSKGIPGLPGLFIAGVFCTVLSTLSANINCLACTIYEDFLKELLDKFGYTNIALIVRLLVVACGIICTSIVYLFINVQNILPVVLAGSSISFGPLLGIFTLGLLFPLANNKGAFYGSLISLGFTIVTVTGMVYYASNGMISQPTKPLSVEKCSSIINSTNGSILIPDMKLNSHYVFPLFKISHIWLSSLGLIIATISGVLISHLTRNKMDKPVSKMLLSPVIHPWLRRHENEEDDEEEKKLMKQCVMLSTRNDSMEMT